MEPAHFILASSQLSSSSHRVNVEDVAVVYQSTHDLSIGDGYLTFMGTHCDESRQMEISSDERRREKRKKKCLVIQMTKTMQFWY